MDALAAFVDQFQRPDRPNTFAAMLARAYAAGALEERFQRFCELWIADVNRRKAAYRAGVVRHGRAAENSGAVAFDTLLREAGSTAA